MLCGIDLKCFSPENCTIIWVIWRYFTVFVIYWVSVFAAGSKRCRWVLGWNLFLMTLTTCLGCWWDCWHTGSEIEGWCLWAAQRLDRWEAWVVSQTSIHRRKIQWSHFWCTYRHAREVLQNPSHAVFQADLKSQHLEESMIKPLKRIPCRVIGGCMHHLWQPKFSDCVRLEVRALIAE